MNKLTFAAQSIVRDIAEKFRFNELEGGNIISLEELVAYALTNADLLQAQGLLIKQPTT